MVCGVISVGPDVPVRIAANAMVSNCVSALPVIDIYAKLVGIVSEGALIRRVEIGTERRRSEAAGETLMSKRLPWRGSSSNRTNYRRCL
jgi:CBS domain-containing protein